MNRIIILVEKYFNFDFYAGLEAVVVRFGSLVLYVRYTWDPDLGPNINYTLSRITELPLHHENKSMKCIPLTPAFIIKLGYRGIHSFLIFAPKHRLRVLVRTASLMRF